MEALLVLALVAPALGVAVAAAAPVAAANATRAAALLAAACWVVVVADGPTGVTAGRVHADPLVAAACCGAALLVTARLAAVRPVPAGSVLLLVQLALAGGRTQNEGWVVSALLVAAGAVAALADRRRDRLPAFAAVAVTAFGFLVVAVLALRQATGAWTIPLAAPQGVSYRAEGLLLLVAAVLLLVAASIHAREGGAGMPLLVAAAFVGVRAAPLVRVGGDFVAGAVVLAALAVVAAAGQRARAPFDRPALALGLLGLAALLAPGPTGPPAALLLAASVLAGAFAFPAAAALGVPGAVGLALALSAAGGAGSLAVGVLAAAVVLGLAARARTAGPPSRPGPWALGPLAIGAWLVLAPGSWGWVGDAGLHSYDLGAARALAAGLLCVVGAAHFGRLRPHWYAHTAFGASSLEDAVRN